MNKLIIILVLYFFFGTNINLYSQWQSDVRMTNNAFDSWVSGNNCWNIASAGDTVHVIWHDNRDGNFEIYYKRSTDAGITWGNDTRLTNNSGASWLPSIIINGSVLHVAWMDNRDGNWEIFYKRSSDAGITWGSDIRLMTNSVWAYYPSLAVYGSFVFLVWRDERDGNKEIYFKRSADEGLSWGNDTRLTNDLADSWLACPAVNGSVVHVIWSDNRDGNDEIYYKRSADGGLSWGADTRLTFDNADSYAPCVVVSGSNLHLVWEDNRDGNWEIYYKRSTDAGLTWGADTRLTNAAGVSATPSIAVSGSSLHVVWYDDRSGNLEVFYKYSSDGGTTWGDDTQLTFNNAATHLPSISVSGSTIHVVWDDTRDGNYEIYYKRNPTGNPTGIVKVSSVVPNKWKLEQNYPNPFNPVTRIRFAITVATRVKLSIYDILGREVSVLINEELKAGIYNAELDASRLASGLYFYRLDAGDYAETKKMILVK